MPTEPTPAPIAARLATQFAALRAWLTRERLQRAGLIALIGSVALVAAAVVYIAILIPLTPSVDDLRDAQAGQASVLLSDDGKPLASFERAQHERVPLAKISKHVVDALIATEDQRFYQHHGVDLRRTFGAALHTLTGDTQGGSTLTQQLARNLFPDEIGRSRNIQRKLKEAITALRIERVWDKQRILETYLNTAPFLYNVVGIEMAARTYFDKPAAQLDVLQSATLVGMLKGTHYYNPVINPERALKRRNVVLAQMAKQQSISAAELRAMRDQPLGVELNRQSEASGPAPHFAAQARKWLIEWADRNDYNVYTDGLRVQTTLDSRLQAAAMQAVERQADALQNVADVEWSAHAVPAVSAAPESYAKQRARVDPFGYLWNGRHDLVEAFLRDTPEFKKALAGGAGEAAALRNLAGDRELMAKLRQRKTRLESGFVAIDPTSGEIKAWVGSRDFERDEFDHVSQAARQPGSTFKPVVYGAALERGFDVDKQYADTAIELKMPDGTVWKPTDMHGSSGKMMSLRDGLVYSKNTITAQVMRDVGAEDVVRLATAMGIDHSKLDPVPSLALGTSPVTLLEMVTAYTTIASEGTHRKPIYIKRITDRKGEVIADFGPESPQRALSATSAVDLIDMMRGVVARGTATQVKTRFGILADIAGKTGTTQNNSDGWFILMHPRLVAGAWVGFNDQRVTMRSDYWGQGGHNAILVVGDFFRNVLQAGLIDPKATFAPPRHPPAPAPTEMPPAGEWASESGQGDVIVEPAGGAVAGAATERREGATVLFGEPAGIAASRSDDAPPKSAEELERALGFRNRGRPPGSVVDAAPRPTQLEREAAPRPLPMERDAPADSAPLPTVRLQRPVETSDDPAKEPVPGR